MTVSDEFSMVGTTGNMELDLVLYGVVGLGHIAFPGRVHSCYLLGSHAAGEAVPASDADVVIVFKDRLAPGEGERFESFRRYCLLVSRSIEVDLSLAEQARLSEAGAVHLKLSSLLLQGDDLRGQLPLMPLDAWVRECMHKPYQFIERCRSRTTGEPLRYPLGLPDPASEYYGYDRRWLKGPDGTLQRSTKELMTLTSRVATALLALEVGVYPYSKRMAVQTYREHMGGDWAQLLEELYAYRQQWGYMLPPEPKDRERFRELCARTVELENHFLRRYQTYLLAELERGALEHRILAAERLGQVLYVGETTVATALEQLASSGEPEPLRQAAARSLTLLRQFT